MYTMRNKICRLFVAAALCGAALLVSCSDGSTPKPKTAAVPTDTLLLPLAGDSTIYGLACDGSNDTLLIILNIDSIGHTGSDDPDTFFILNATKHHRVYGRTRIGDHVAVVRSATRPDEADIVIVTEDLMQPWRFLQFPQLKERVGMTGREQMNEMPDSIRQQLATPREVGYTLKADRTVSISGVYRLQTTIDDDPIVYPEMKHYHYWHLLNGEIVLTETRFDSTGTARVTSRDTASLVLLRPDSLVLRFADGLKSFYCKMPEDE